MDPSLEVTATMRGDDGVVTQAVRDTSIPDMHRMQFHMEAPPTQPSWDVRIDITVPQGYIAQPNLLYQLGDGGGGHELEPNVNIEAEPPPPPVLTKRTGVVVATGKASQDLQGFASAGDYALLGHAGVEDGAGSLQAERCLPEGQGL